ncbi:hypothetical protein KP509_27G014700 [Ceratopteris richardii]|uniref:Translocon-associated protein subunit beta n=1 Tax=Ceratopteris richardii TaxID=49495 RepID=A0A8T2RFI1_CERRI|nr:hypothetical protein KP509_27G014700 [Ceratopteris richardii]
MRIHAVLVCSFLSHLLCDCASSVDDAFLIVQKRASISKLKSAEHITVSFSIHNVGFSTAYDVTLNDDTWPSDKFELVSGNTSNSWDRLDGGKTLAHVFVLESKEKSVFYGAPAIVKYRVASKSALQEAYSTPLHELDLLSEKYHNQKFELLKVYAVNYGPLMSVILIVSMFTYVLVMPSKSKAAKSKKRK